MTHLLLMLAMATAMALLREPLGRGLVRMVEAVRWKRLAALAVVLFLLWISLQTFHVGLVAPLTGDTLAILFDYTVIYADLLVAATFAVLNRQTRQLFARMVDLARFAGHRVLRRAGRAARAPARPRRRPPDREEPEPAVWAGVLAFA